MSSTIGDTCQTWGSNQVHYEGNFLEFWKKPLSIPTEGVSFNDMTPELKEAAKMVCLDGILVKINLCLIIIVETQITLRAHRCYTTNPKNRWQYCAIPDNSTKTRYYILIFVFLMLIVLAIFLVKLIFRYEYFADFVSKITGGKLTSETVTGAVSKPEVPSSTGTTVAAAATSAAKFGIIIVLFI